MEHEWMKTLTNADTVHYTLKPVIDESLFSIFDRNNSFIGSKISNIEELVESTMWCPSEIDPKGILVGKLSKIVKDRVPNIYDHSIIINK